MGDNIHLFIDVTGANADSRMFVNDSKKRRLLEDGQIIKTTKFPNGLVSKTDPMELRIHGNKHTNTRTKKLISGDSLHQRLANDIQDISSPNRDNTNNADIETAYYLHSANKRTHVKENIPEVSNSAKTTRSKNLIQKFNDSVRSTSKSTSSASLITRRQKFDIDVLSNEFALQVPEVKTKRRQLIENKHNILQKQEQKSTPLDQTGNCKRKQDGLISKPDSLEHSIELHDSPKKVMRITATLEGSGEVSEKELDIEFVESQSKSSDKLEHESENNVVLPLNSVRT